MNTELQHTVDHVGCPRCDYDLSGEVQRWNDECPLDGVCSECGLKIRWGDFLAKDARRPEAFFETSRGHPRRAYTYTFKKAFNPYRFWNWVKMEYEFNWKRMLSLSFGGMLALHAVLTLAATLLCLLIHATAMLNAPAFTTQFQRYMDSIANTAKVVGIPFAGDSRNWWYAGSPLVGSPVWILMGLLSVAAMPGAFLLLPATLSKAKVRTAHLLRVTCYGCIWMPLVWFTLTAPSVLNSAIDTHLWYLGRAYGGGGGNTPSSWQIAFAYFMNTKELIVGTLVEYEYAITLALVFGWNVVWWWCAGRFYLKIPRPFSVSIVLMILSVLTLMVMSLPIFGLEALNRLFPT